MDFLKCVKRNTQVKGIFKCDFVWGPPSKFGCTWSAQQVRIKVPKTLDEYAFMEDSDEENSVSLQNDGFVDTESEEEEIERA